MPFLIVEDHLEQPLSECQIVLNKLRDAVPVFDALEVAIGRPHTISLVGLASIDVFIILRCVFVDDGVALVVVALADEPAEDTRRIDRGRIGGLDVHPSSPFGRGRRCPPPPEANIA